MLDRHLDRRLRELDDAFALDQLDVAPRGEAQPVAQCLGDNQATSTVHGGTHGRRLPLRPGDHRSTEAAPGETLHEAAEAQVREREPGQQLTATVIAAVTTAMATELVNQVPTGKADSTRSKFSMVTVRGHSRRSTPSSSARVEKPRRASSTASR